MKRKAANARTRRVGVVIAAGGKGLRMGGKTPKQFLPLAGMPVIVRTIATFDAHPAVHDIVVVVPHAALSRMRSLAGREEFRKVRAIVAGGNERQDSVRAGLLAFHPSPDIVLVHDAVRPLVDRRTIRAVIAAAVRRGAAVVGVPVSDTIKKESRPGSYGLTLDRSRLWAVQTPQGFRFTLLKRAHDRAEKDGFIGTDESSLLERLGIRVGIVRGSTLNIKLTTKEDMRLAAALLETGLPGARK